MKTTRYILYLLIGCCILACVNKPTKRKDNGKPFKIAVLHSYDENESGYVEYNRELAQNFKEHGVDVNLVHYYLQLHSGYSIDYNNLPSIADSLKNNDFDLVITEGTLACYKTVSYLSRHNQTELPIVSGGVSVQVWDSLTVYPKLYVWMDEIDYPRLIRLATTFQKTNIVRIELDHNFLDEKQRADLKYDINRPPFYNNVDLKSAAATQLGNPDFKDSIVVMAVSAEEPNSNVADLGEGRKDTLTLQSLLSYASDIPTVVVKKDLFSNVLEGATKIPQFTALPYDFGDSNTHYLAGYFTPFSTQASDVVQTAIKLLSGNGKDKLWQGRHSRKVYMDYNCFVSYPGLKYEDYADEYIIVNAPFKVVHPYLYAALRITLFLIVLLIIILTVYIYLRYKNRRGTTLKDSLIHSNLEILGAGNMVFCYEVGKGIEFCTIVGDKTKTTLSHTLAFQDIPKMFHPETTNGYEHFLELCQQPGYHIAEDLLTFNQGRDYHWWRTRFFTEEIIDKKNNTVNYIATGVVVNIDAWRKKQHEIQKAQEKAEEVKRRDDFMRTLNHEIRTPLNSVLGFGELITAKDLEITSEEKEEYCRTIKHNVNRLNNLVTDILSFSRMESGRMRFNMQELPVNSFMDTVVSDAKAWVEGKWLIDDQGNDKTGKLKLEYIPGWGEHKIKADPTHLQHVFRQLISNAIKFCDGGVIHVGWCLELQTKEIAIFVEDSGIGIPEEEQENIFRFFYKADRMHRGVGLGLSISHALIEKMGGKLVVRSHVGMGSRFIILMPLV